MGKRKRYTAEEKMKILREILEDGKSVSTVAENHDLHPNNIFSWRKALFEGGLHIFEIKRTDISEKAETRKLHALESKIKQKDDVIAELAAENLAQKRKELWPNIGKSKTSLQTRTTAEKEILHLNKQTGIPVKTLLEYAGIPRRTWTEWMTRWGIETKHNNKTPKI